MKRLFASLQYTLLGVGVAVLFASLSTAPVYAANPTTIPFQGKVVNSNGTNVTDGTYSFTFKLYTTASGGTALWGETQASVQVTSGVFQANLGSTCSLFTTQTCSGFSNTAIDFNANPSLYLGVTFNNDPAGEMTPRIQLGSVPYAFNADKVGGLGVSQLVQLSPSSQQAGSINISGNLQAAGSVQLGSTTAAGSIILKDGTATGNTVTLNSVGLAATYVLNLPTTAPTTTGQCLSTSSTTQLSFVNCNSFTSLNQAYANSTTPANILLTDAKDLSITAADTATDPNVLVNLQCTTSCGSNGRFAVQNGGTDVFTISPNGGAVTFQNSTNSTSALRILSAGSSSRTILGVNTVSSQVAIDGNFMVMTSDPVMTASIVAAAGNTGGALSGSASSKYFYRVSAVTASGETAASTETSISGSAFTPISAPSGYTLTFTTGANGGITGTYFYTVTFVTANGESTAGPGFSFTSNGKQVNVNNLPIGPSGVIARRVYRTAAGGVDGTEKFVGEVSDNTTTTYTDSAQDASLGSALPTINNARVNTNTTTVSWSAYPGATSYRVYRGTAPGAENSYQTATASPFTDKGATGTSATPFDATTGRVGIGTTTPGYKLDVSGNLNVSGTYLSNGIFGVSNTCASGTTFSGITVSGGIITSTGSCVGVSGGGGGGGGSASLQDAYNTSGTATPQIQLSATNGGLKIYDASTSVGNTLSVSDSTGGNLYFAVTSSGVKANIIDAASGTVLYLGATASPQATSIILSQDTTVAANHVLNFANGGNSNLISLTAASGSAGYALTLPSTGPAINQCLQTGAVTPGLLVWGSCSSGGGVSIGTLDSQTKSSNGAVAVSGVLYLQSADGSNPGLLTAGAQTIGGAKTFNGTLAVGSVLTADIANNVVQIGSAATDTTQTNLQLDSSSNFTESGTCTTTTSQGAMYFNTASNSIRACINGAWEDLVSTNGLGILTFGVVADSGSTNPGDLANKASTTAGSGPCKVAWASTTSVSITDCIAYSGGRKVVVAAQPSVTIPTKNGNWVHICLNGANGQPAVSAQGTETANLPNTASSDLVRTPIVCLADIKTSANSITGIYDTRVFTNTQKTFVNTAIAMGLGWIAKDNGVASASTVTATGSANQPFLKGVIVASTGTAWSAGSGPTAVMVYSGPAFVKAASGTLSATGYVSTTTTTGYATITTASTANNAVTNLYNSLGIAETAYSATCTTATNCNLSLLVNLDIR